MSQNMLRSHIQNEIRKMWETVATGALLGNPPEDIAVFEHARARVEEARCLGQGKLIELLDRKCQPIAPPETYSFDCGSRQESYWQHAQASFFVDELETVGVAELRFGPKYGRGFSYEVVCDEGRSEIVKKRPWVS
jgi:hypothetical protein